MVEVLIVDSSNDASTERLDSSTDGVLKCWIPQQMESSVGFVQLIFSVDVTVLLVKLTSFCMSSKKVRGSFIPEKKTQTI